MNYKHTCDACLFLGTHENFSTKIKSDLYFCFHLEMIIARYGSDGIKYKEGHVEAIKGFEDDFLEEIVEGRRLTNILLEEGKLIKYFKGEQIKYVR